MSDEKPVEIACDQDECDFVARPRGTWSADAVLGQHKATKHKIFRRTEEQRARDREARQKKEAKRKGTKRTRARTVPAEDAQAPAAAAAAEDEGPAEYVPGFGTLPEAPAAPRGWRERLWHRPIRSLEAKPDKPPARRRKRAETAELLGMMWGGAGWAAIRLGDAPVGRAMQLQVPAAGPILEKITADTAIDRALLQPLARNAEAWKDAGALLMLPVAVAVIERSPEMAVVLEPMLRELVLTNAATIVPILQKRQADEAKREAALEALGIGGVDEILAAIFAPSATAPPPGGAEAGASSNGAGEDVGPMAAGSWQPGAPTF